MAWSFRQGPRLPFRPRHSRLAWACSGRAKVRCGMASCCEGVIHGVLPSKERLTSLGLTGNRNTEASMSRTAALPWPWPAGMAAAFAPETAPRAAAPTRIAAFFLTELIRTMVWECSTSDPNDDRNGWRERV